MDADRANRVVAALRARNVMAHLVEAGVYEFGIRVVLDEGIEALWDIDGASGLDAEIVSDGVLIGFVPHVPGSESFTEQQIVDSIATTRYSAEGLHPPQDSPPAPSPTGPSPTGPAGLPADAAPRAEPPPTTSPATRHQRRAHWLHRNGD